MEFELIRGSHSVGEANYHIQITPAFRKGVFADETTRILTRDYLLAAANRHRITVAAIGFGPDHCHVFTENCKNYGPAQVAKGALGKQVLDKRLLLQDSWRCQCETVKRYVEQSQREHWKAVTGVQKRLLEFTAN